MKGFVVLICGFASLLSAQTTVRFSVNQGNGADSAYSAGPFPTNALTVPDRTEQTGLRVELPDANDNCDLQPSAVCGYSALLNQLDGFSVNPRIMVCFSGPVDVPTLARGIEIVPAAGGQSIGVQRVIWDPSTHCGYAKPLHPLLQQSKYLVAITTDVMSGTASVQPDPAFRACLAGSGSYCSQLAAAVKTAGLSSATLAGASLFTTMSVTPWMEGAHQLTSRLPAIGLPAGLVSYFPLNSVKSLTYAPSNSGMAPVRIPLDLLAGVKAVYFGLFISPLYINTSGTAIGTITHGPFQPTAFEPVSFHAFLPENSHGKPPVVIYVHGSGDTQFGAPTFMTSTLARNGFAVLSFELLGHGFGSASTVAVTLKSGLTLHEATPGRGVALTPGQPIGAQSGCIAPGPIGIRDCVRQNAVDLFSLVRLIRQTNGLGLGLDPQRIYVLGQSLGAITSSVALPEMPDVHAAVLNGDGGSTVNIAELSPVELPLAEELLTSLRNPHLFNVADGATPPQFPFNPAFNEDFVFPGQPPVRNQIPYAMNIQAAFETAEWLNMLGDPLAFGPYLSSHVLPGSTSKRALFQFGVSDLEVPNPTEAAAVIAANGQNSTWILNFPKAVSIAPELQDLEDPEIPALHILPHRILSNPTIFAPSNGSELSLSLAEQDQVAGFFSSDGQSIVNPNQFLSDPFSSTNPVFFAGPLPTGLNYLP